MSGPPDLWLYTAVVFGVIVLPGMDMAYVLASSLVAGTRGGFTAVAGIVAGGVVHFLVALTGIAAVLLWAPTAFNAVLLAGAAYVAWLGVSLLRSPAQWAPQAGQTDTGLSRIFTRAMATCLLNPKAYAFTLAVLPLFLYGSSRPLPLQVALLSMITAAVQLLVYGTVALAAARLGCRLSDQAAGGQWLGRVVAVLLIAVAILTAIGAWRTTTPPTQGPTTSFHSLVEVPGRLTVDTTPSAANQQHVQRSEWPGSV